MSARPPDAPTTVSLADEDGVKRIVIDTLFGLWATVNNLSRLRPSRRERYRVTIFGSARTKPGHWVYQRRSPSSASTTHAGRLLSGNRPEPYPPFSTCPPNS